MAGSCNKKPQTLNPKEISILCVLCGFVPYVPPQSVCGLWFRVCVFVVMYLKVFNALKGFGVVLCSIPIDGWRSLPQEQSAKTGTF